MMALMNVRGVAILAWLLTSGAMATLIGRELGWGASLHLAVPTPPAQSTPKVNTELLPNFVLPEPEKKFTETLDRPLFVPTRRKAPQPEAEKPPKPTMKKGQFQLLGTVITESFKAAIIKEIDSGKERQLMQGFDVNGMKLDQVEVDRIVLTQYEDREEIRLKIQPSRKELTQDNQPLKVLPGRKAAIGVGQVVNPAGQASGQIRQRQNVRQPSQEIQTMEDRTQNPLFKDFYKK